jgi:hypothetical protein
MFPSIAAIVQLPLFFWQAYRVSTFSIRVNKSTNFNFVWSLLAFLMKFGYAGATFKFRRPFEPLVQVGLIAEAANKIFK